MPGLAFLNANFVFFLNLVFMNRKVFLRLCAAFPKTQTII